MSHHREALLMRADRVRVSRKTQEGGMSHHREALLMRADRVRVSRKTQEAK